MPANTPATNPIPARPPRAGLAGIGAVWVLALGLAGALSEARAAEPGPEAFATDILPILTRAGCNSGACHGAATGQGGFKLSLLGYAPSLDHERITRELGARRVDFSRPDQSLLLRKALRLTDHEGGRRLLAGAPGTVRLQDWIARGAPMGAPDLRVVGLAAEPAVVRQIAPPGPQSIRIHATLSDGRRTDVSELALISSNDDAVAEVDKTGKVRVIGPGSTAIMIRFAGAVTAVRVDHPFPNPVPKFPQDLATSTHPVDRAVLRRLGELRVPASPAVAPAGFLRRLHLDLIGRLPEPAEIEKHLAEPETPARRAAQADRLLASEEFTDLWTLRLADLLLLGGKRAGEAGARTQHDWLRQRVAGNIGWDRITRELVTAKGAVATNGATAFASLASDPRDLGEQAASLFLGARVACARCHAHPSDRWTRRDYHQFAAFFARIRRDGGRVEDADTGEVEDPESGRPLPPRALGEFEPIGTDVDRRLALADWLTGADNPLFARAMVNRVWKHLMGRGLVEPSDDLRPTNPATHPELLDELAAGFVRSGYDLRNLIRTIVLSETYRRSATTVPGNETDRTLYSHASLKALDGRVLLDLIAQATGVDEEFTGQPGTTRAVQLADARTPSQALDILGRCNREAACEAPGVDGGGLARALHLINGTTIQSRLQRGHLATWLKDGIDPAGLVRRLYLRTLSRPPTPEELTAWTGRLRAEPTHKEVAEDLLWALLNSREFIYNH